MSDERKERLEELLEEVQAVSPAQRSDFILAACQRDPEISAELSALLESEQDFSLTEFLEEGLPEILQSAAESTPERKLDRKSTRLDSSHTDISRRPSS